MRAIAAMVVTLTLLFLGQGAKAQQHLGEMKQNCEQLEDFWRLYPPTKDSTPVPEPPYAAICFGYIQACVGLASMMGVPSYNVLQECAVTAEGKVEGGPACGHTLGFCFPDGISYSQVLAVFLAYARSHAAQWHERTAQHFDQAMMTAFPCKDEYPTPWLDAPAQAR